MRYQQAVEKLQYYLIWMVPFLFSLSFHEFAHSWTANRFGDATSRLMGRMTLNPSVHIDPIGTLLFPTLSFFTGFSFIGWANPVMVNERNLKNPLRDGMLVALAGPISNILLAVVFAVILFSIRRMSLNLPIIEPLELMLAIGIRLNCFLAMFNLLPFPPLDGGRVIYGLFPDMHETLNWVSRNGFIILIVLMYTGALSVLLSPADWLSRAILQVVN